MRNHPRPLVKGVGGEKQNNGSNTAWLRNLAAPVNDAAAWDRLTARLVLEQARNGTLDIAILEALLLAYRGKAFARLGLEP